MNSSRLPLSVCQCRELGEPRTRSSSCRSSTEQFTLGLNNSRFKEESRFKS